MPTTKRKICDGEEPVCSEAKRKKEDCEFQSTQSITTSYLIGKAVEPSRTNSQPYGDVAKDYTIGWICALQEEYEAACRMLDHEFDGPEANEVNDNNAYVFGRIGRHNVVIGCLPTGRYGISSATSVAKDMVRSFPNLRFALMVGIGGGAPTQERDIRLGDVVVSVPQRRLGGVVQYDFGKRLSDGRFQQTGQLDAPPPVLLGVIPEMRRRHNDRRMPDKVAEHLKLIDDMPGYKRPTEDRLYRADFEHKGGTNCENCDADGLEERPRRETSREVTVHYGIIASANSVMKDARERDLYANDPELNVLCFEMEASGLMNNFPCLVIRGICDYSDSHKNDEWHNYAALAAAAYARELLHVLKPQRVTLVPSWAGKIEKLLAGFQERVKKMSRKADKIICHQQDQGGKDILDWLTPVNYGPQHSDYINRRQPGTGQWLLDSAQFKAWVET
ncbi:WD domain-containing protein, partial [Phaeosphaeriaceae sp. PMI808]